MKARYLLGLLLAFTLPATAEVQTKTIDYKDGDTQLHGVLAWDDSDTSPKPGIIVVHEWWGLNDYAKQRARQLAEMGYVAFAADMYGGNQVTSHAKEAKGWMMQITSNIDNWRQRAQAGLKVLQEQPMVDKNNLAAIGYCFGGATVMQMAYGGTDLKGVASFHGSLPPAANEEEAKQIKAKVMIAHGEDDAFIPKEQIGQFKTMLDKGGVDWQFTSYSGARHAFTNPDADSHGIDNIKYNADADRRSWLHLSLFLHEIFSEENDQ